MKTTLTVCLLLTMVLCSGCVTIHYDPSREDKGDSLVAGIKCASVRAMPAIAARQDTFKLLGDTYVVDTGKVFRSIFCGDGSSAATIEILNASLSQNTSDIMLYWNTTAVTYSVSVLLVAPDGRKHALHSTATESSARLTPEKATRAAVQKAALDIYRQAEALL